MRREHFHALSLGQIAVFYQLVASIPLAQVFNSPWSLMASSQSSPASTNPTSDPSPSSSPAQSTHDYNPAGKTIPVLSASSIPGLDTLSQTVTCLPPDQSLKARSPITNDSCAPIIAQMQNLGYGLRTWDQGEDYQWNDFSQSPCVVELESTGSGVDVFHRDDVIDAAQAVLTSSARSGSGGQGCIFGGAVGIAGQASWFVAVFAVGTAAGDDERDNSNVPVTVNETSPGGDEP